MTLFYRLLLSPIFHCSAPIISLYSNVTTETGFWYVYSTHSQAELTVDHGHEISTFQHGLRCIYASLHSHNM